MPSSRHANMTRNAISPRLATRIFLNMAARLATEPDREQALAVLHRLAVLDVDVRDLPVVLGVDLVHQLHRLDDAEHLALADRVADLDERLGPGLGGTVE